MSAPILITGATGFVIANLVRHLAEQGHDVVAADLLPPDDRLRRYLSGLPGRVEFRQIDVRDAKAINRLATETRPSRGVAGAALTSIPEDTERSRFIETVQVNVVGTLNTLEALRQAETGRIVVVSSGSVYGRRSNFDPIFEDDEKGPEALYPITKWAGEALARRFGEVHGLDLGVVRLCSPFGPFERDTGSRPLLSPMSGWAHAAVRGETVEVLGGPELLRDVAYAPDVASGIAAVLFADRLSSRVYNVGWGRSVSSREALETLSQVVQGLRYRFDPERQSPWVSTSNPPRGPLSNVRLMSELGWRPSFDLDSGLRAYVEWLRSESD